MNKRLVLRVTSIEKLQVLYIQLTAQRPFIRKPHSEAISSRHLRKCCVSFFSRPSVEFGGNFLFQVLQCDQLIHDFSPKRTVCSAVIVLHRSCLFGLWLPASFECAGGAETDRKTSTFAYGTWSASTFRARLISSSISPRS